MSKWIRFEEQPIEKGKKLATYKVLTKDGDTLLGKISWYGAWRCYSFYPEPGTLFEKTCLLDITEFLIDIQNEWKEKRSKQNIS